jgi:ATP adenylyltransferase
VRRIWAGWRMEYILGDKSQECVFCRALQGHDDAASHIVYRGERVVLMLNRFPYTNGHLLVVPLTHAGDLAELDRETLADMMLLTAKGIELLRAAMNPHGFNVGLNLGQAAGAGIRDHVHVHIVPRWENDTNFMPVLGEVRVIPEWLEDTYTKLRAALRTLTEGADTLL